MSELMGAVLALAALPVVVLLYCAVAFAIITGWGWLNARAPRLAVAVLVLAVLLVALGAVLEAFDAGGCHEDEWGIEYGRDC